MYVKYKSKELLWSHISRTKMKLLTWMQRKIRQNNNEMFKEFPHGQTILNNEAIYQKKYQSVNFPVAGRDSLKRGSFSSRESGVPEREPSVESFDGFLAIGTLGSEAYVWEPQTPTFGISVDNIAERETEATESELNLISEELEKVLAEAEAKEADSCRSSHARSSNTSMISLSESGESRKSTTATSCPLQGFLFGSAVELPGRKSSAGKKSRASLGELFQRHKAEESAGGGGGGLMRKKLGKKSSANYASETKFHKMLHLFHKKVHPETSMDVLKKNTHNNSTKAGYYCINDVDSFFAGDDGLFRLSDDIVQQRNQSFPSQISSECCDSIENREFWIKTDADYLVLEL